MKSEFYLKLAYQGLIKPLGIWKDIKTTIICMLTRVNFEVIEHNSSSNSYPAIFGHPWGINMKENISLSKEWINIKGSGKKVIITLDPREVKPWDELNNEVTGVHQLYQSMKNNKDTIDPNKKEEIYLGSHMSVGQNSENLS